MIDEKIKQEELKRRRRQNRIAEQLESKTYVKADDVEKMIQLGIQVLGNIPSRAQSQYGLTPDRAAGVEKLIDEARSEWSLKLLKM